MKKLLLVVFNFLSVLSYAQTCNNLGQNPATAFPVCGSTTFAQSSVAICGIRQIPTPCTNSGALFMDKNPYWYKFTCYTAGTLGFEITPTNLSDDYDWQIFDITGRNANDVYTDRSLFVACNWSGDGGKTGAGPSGTSTIVCDGYGRPLYSSMPVLTRGHQYLLLVSHFTNSQSGYALSFGGGTASIIDPTASAIAAVKPNCDGSTISLKINKSVTCKSLAADGSDFKISSPLIKITGANGVNCNQGFDLDSIVLTLDQPLPPGSYTVSTQKGSDGNTLLDYCQVPMKEGITSTFNIQILQPTPFDSITAVSCSPRQLQLEFKKPIQCASVAANGSDFTIDPASGVSITGATTVCNNLVSSTITLNLSAPIIKKGIFKVTLTTGTDGNTIIDECSQQTPAGATVNVVSNNVVSAAFTYQVGYGCNADTVQFFHAGGNDVNSWAWQFNARGNSVQQNPLVMFSKFGKQQVNLLVSNGVCSDTAVVNFVLDNELKADFSGPTLLCPGDDASFKDSSIGKITSWYWNFGNGVSSNEALPSIIKYQQVTTRTTYRVVLIVKDSFNCADTVMKPVTVLTNCFIAVASAFTPNGDGLNDYLYPINAFKATNLTFRVFNRLGQLVFETNDFTNKWDGTFKGVPQATGTYVYTLQYVHADTRQPVFMKGTSVLIR